MLRLTQHTSTHTEAQDMPAGGFIFNTDNLVVMQVGPKLLLQLQNSQPAAHSSGH